MFIYSVCVLYILFEIFCDDLRRVSCSVSQWKYFRRGGINQVSQEMTFVISLSFSRQRILNIITFINVLFIYHRPLIVIYPEIFQHCFLNLG